jgi:hypothetical protein
MKKLVIFALFFGLSEIAQAQNEPPAYLLTRAPPAVIDLKMTSTDPQYGYSKEKPIKVGSKSEHGGPSSERKYLNSLRDDARKPIKFKRLGSFGLGPYGNIIDGYEVLTSSGRIFTIYIDMYHPNSDPNAQLAPKGFYKAK